MQSHHSDGMYDDMQEMAEAEEAAKKKRKVPKGTSTYQAAWILDDEGDDEDIEEGDELVEYNSDPEEAQAPGTIAASEFGGMTEFPDEDDDAMEVCCLVSCISLRVCVVSSICVSEGCPSVFSSASTALTGLASLPSCTVLQEAAASDAE